MIDPYKVDEFTRGYMECMLWAETDQADESGGEFLDANYDITDISQEALAVIVEDCRQFQEKAGDLICEENCGKYDYTPASRAGHDFWLTRHHHGAGFWDGDWKGESGEKLTELAQSFKELDIYVGDDGQLYF